MTMLRSWAGLAKKAAGILVLPALAAAAIATATTGSTGCVTSEAPPPLKGQVHLTLIHTSDIHSRLFPYNLQIGQVDAGLGLGASGSIANVGGVARISHIIGRERARSSRVLHIDGGDCFQGAPIFNFYAGEAEIRALSAMGADAMIVANHEFDRGALNLAIQLQNWADYPVLAANYLLEDPSMPGASPLGSIMQPYTTFNLDGLKVAVIGMGNLSSITSIFEAPNRLGITPLNTIEVAQFYVDLLRPAVDLIVFVTHLGLEVDERMIANTTGIDVVLGGHNHIVLQPPKRVRDCANVDDEGRHYIELLSSEDATDLNSEHPKVRRYCTPRDVILAHSGAFAKYVARLDLVLSNNPDDFKDDPEKVYDPLNGFESLTHELKLFPVTENEPNDPIVYELLEPYGQGLDALANLELLVGYALDGSRRFSTTGGDSPLGNMVATAARLRLGVQTDFSLTNTTGIRADLVPGPVTVEQMYNIFPFDNSITKMQLSGCEVKDLFDFAARRSAGRGCVSQVQIDGARVVIDCSAYTKKGQVDPGFESCPVPGEDQIRPGVATHVFIGASDKACANDADCGGEFGSCDAEGTGRCWIPIDGLSTYELATSNYLAQGGSGFRVLQRNTTQFDTQIQQRDALIDFIRAGAACGADDSGDLRLCSTDADCADLGTGNEAFVCACTASSIDCSIDPDACKSTAIGAAAGDVCKSDPETSCSGAGSCVLAKCRDDVATFQRETCDAAPTEGVKKECENALLPCASGGEQCKFLSCVNRRIGNFSDGRLRMVGQ
ncbi:MAG: 5'-nucleotidase C-terminal domain-containing protein [Polyangiaceae bacterium]|nr:5'-nucleotidase C-terminal domain-containing protein [Polyangiaceae bacterium]